MGTSWKALLKIAISANIVWVSIYGRPGNVSWLWILPLKKIVFTAYSDIK